MTARTKRILLTLISGSALAVAPIAFATVVVPATSSADECADGQPRAAEANQPCGDRGQAKPQSVSCNDGQVVDAENGKCVALLDGISKQLQALPAPPSLSGLGGGGGVDGIGALGSLPGGIPSLGTVSPTLVLPSVGFQVVPNLNVTPDLGGLFSGAVGAAGANAAANALTALPAPGLPAPPAINPLNPLGLPPPPDLTPGIPLI